MLKSSFFWFAFAAFMVLVLGPVIALWRWDWLSDGGSETASNGETLRNAGLLIGGALAFVFAGWRAWVAERQAGTAKDQADTARVQADTAKLQADTAERQSTTALWSLLNERYEQGASRLGSDDLTVRMEGMDMLERLARDHPQEYHVQVMKRLSLFVRTSHVPQRFLGEVRAAMAAIGSRSKEDIGFEDNETFELNLSGSDLHSVLLAHLNLSGSILMSVNLSGADLMTADLSNARLLRANLTDAWLFEANLSGAQFSVGEGDYPAEGLTQAQLDTAHSYQDNLPKLAGVLDANSGEQLKPPTREPDFWDTITELAKTLKEGQSEPHREES